MNTFPFVSRQDCHVNKEYLQSTLLVRMTKQEVSQAGGRLLRFVRADQMPAIVQHEQIRVRQQFLQIGGAVGMAELQAEGEEEEEKRART